MNKEVQLCDIVPCGLPVKVNVKGCISGKGMCSRHHHRLYKHGTPWPKGVRSPQVKNGKYATYLAMHKRVYAAKGRAAEHDCVDCGGEAREWSYNNSGVGEVEGDHAARARKYSMDVNQYEPRCCSCHRAFDEHPNFMRRSDAANEAV